MSIIDDEPRSHYEAAGGPTLSCRLPPFRALVRGLEEDGFELMGHVAHKYLGTRKVGAVLFDRSRGTYATVWNQFFVLARVTFCTEMVDGTIVFTYGVPFPVQTSETVRRNSSSGDLRSHAKHRALLATVDSEPRRSGGGGSAAGSVERLVELIRADHAQAATEPEVCGILGNVAE
jgi:hypothetical protein